MAGAHLIRTALATLAALAACSRGPARPPDPSAAGTGGRIAAGDARALAGSADGAWVAWLDGCHVARGQYLPPGTAACTLRVAPARGGGGERVAGAVTTLPHGLAWSPTGATLAALADFDYAAGTGTLVAWRGGETREIGRGVTFHGFGPGGELGFVAGGRLGILLPGDAAPREVPGAEGIASFDFAPASTGRCEGDRLLLLARRTRAAGGELLAVGCRLAGARAVAGPVGEYGFAPDGAAFAATIEGKAGPTLRVEPLSPPGPAFGAGRRVQRFAFAPGGGAVAFLADAEPGGQGSLEVAAPGKPAARIARDVGEFLWAARAPRLAWLERFDPRTRSGTVGVGGPGIAPRTFGRNVSDVALSPDGRAAAFLQHTARGGYSVDLLRVTVGDPAAAAETVAHGVFGFTFSPDGRWLYYRTRCTRNAEACDLERIPAGGLAKGGAPERLAEGVKSFEFDPRDPSRLLVGWQRMDRAALDVAVWRDGKLARIGEVVLPGSARFLPPDSRRVGFVVVDPKRAGVYAVDAP